MSRSSRKSRSNEHKKFVLYVKKYDENGFLEEDQCGWIGFNNDDNKPVLKFSYKEAKVFEEKESGHGSYEDWKNFFEEEHPLWKINPPLYV